MFIKRDIITKINKYLASPEILLLVGARQVGKTSLMKEIQKNLQQEEKICYFLNLEDPEYLSLLNQHPRNLFKIFSFNLQTEKKYFVFVDEIQYLDNPSNFLKYIFDEYQEKIKLIVSGSSAFYIDDKFTDSLAGRKKIFFIKTLSFLEFLRFQGEEELAEKNLAELPLTEQKKVEIFYQSFLVYGGYPRVALATDPTEKKEILQELTYAYVKKDILEAGVRSPEIFYKLFKILAQQVGQLVNTNELANVLDVSRNRIKKYLEVMQKSFHLALIRPFSKTIRKELVKMPKVFFYDLGLRNFFVNSFNAWEFRQDQGELLENGIFRQLLEKNDLTEIKFWRTTDHQEVDFVVNEKQAWEVKVQSKQFYLKKYQKFITRFPEIDFQIACLEKNSVTEKNNKRIPEKFPWEI